MADSWREVRLGDCVVINDDTYSPKEAWPFINYLDTGNITMNRIADVQHLDAAVDKVPSRARRKVQPGDIVYSMVRPNQRHFGIIKDPPENLLASTGFAVLRGKEGIAETDFLYWHLAQDHIVEQLHTIAEHSTSAYPSIRPADLERLELRLPPMREQRRIAGVLGCLDDKIELNRRMAETLEQMARALFRSWFVDFEPVRAKQEGRWRPGLSLPGLPAHLYEAFPDHLDPSELGPIPAGWRVAALGELCRKPQYGYTASAEEEPVGPKFLRIKDINKSSWIDWSTVPHCTISDDNIARYRLEEGDIVIARMADPGHGVLIEEDRSAVFASYLIRFRPLDQAYARFLQYWLRSDAYWALVAGRRTGTTRANLNAKMLAAFPLVSPPRDIAASFGEVITCLRASVVAGATQSYTIGSLRNQLQQQLIGGEAPSPRR